MMNGVSKTFNENANNGLPQTDFTAYLAKKFNPATASKVVDALTGMGLPLPETNDEFFTGTDGCMLFLNKYGVVLRVEYADNEDSEWPGDRINDSGWVLQPIGTIQAGSALIEVCPGCHFEHGEASARFLEDRLYNQGVNFWDNDRNNIGLLPLKTSTFPDGVPVVIDRLATTRLSRPEQSVIEEWKAQAEEILAAQEMLYGPLRKAFATDIQSFWKLCEEGVSSGLLTTGWLEAHSDDKNPKRAIIVGEAYGQRLETVTTSAPAEKFTFMGWLDGKKQSAEPATEFPDTDFFLHVRERFGDKAALKVLEVFTNLHLPPPENAAEYMKSQDGYLMFLNEYGLVLRVEESDKPARVNDSPFVLNPLLSVDAGWAVVEICAGCHQENDKERIRETARYLRDLDYDFWDRKTSNVGRMPIKTPNFPEGVTVVIDRGAVGKLTDSTRSASLVLEYLWKLEDLKQEAARAEKELYQPLRNSFAHLWDNPTDEGAAEALWSLCRRYVAEGKLVAGWNAPQPVEVQNEKCDFGDNSKTPEAAQIAARYATAHKPKGPGPS